MRSSWRTLRRRRVAASLVAAGLVVALGAAPGAAGSAAHAAVSTAARARAAFRAVCYGRAAVYKVPAAVMKAKCGVGIDPLARVVALPGGGKRYSYRDGDWTAVPPRRFNPLRATAAKLREYGVPPRPRGGSGLTAWKAMVRNYDHGLVAPPPYEVVGAHRVSWPAQAARAASRPSATVHRNYLWAGNVAVSHTYTDAYAVYDEPHSFPSVCSSAGEYTWAGLGGYNSTTVAQAGTALGPYSITRSQYHQAWWEVTPGKSHNVQVYATPGRKFSASVHWEGGSYYFYWKNYYTGAHYPIVIPSSNYDGSSAEAVAERPPGFDLTNFVQFKMISAQAAVNYGSYRGISSWPHQDWQIKDIGGSVIAYPGAASNDGRSWYVHETRCY